MAELIVYVDVSRREEYLKHVCEDGGSFSLKCRFEKLSGLPCLILHYAEATPDWIERLRPKAILMSGFLTNFELFDRGSFYPLAEVVHHVDIPLLGICGSHQFLGYVFRGGVDSLRTEFIRKLERDEPDLTTSPNSAGYYIQRGFYPVKIERKDPLFEGLGKQIMVAQEHYAELKKLPSEFVLLASAKDSKIQALRHRSRPLYGVQFHPERFTQKYPDGKTILRNFFRLAGITPPADPDASQAASKTIL